MHFEHNNLWHVFQSACRLRHSSETALLRVLNDILTSSDSDHISVLTLLDLSAAFDTIDHDLLLNHSIDFFFFGGGGAFVTLLAFVRSYLSGKKQIASALGRESKPSSLS